MEILSGWAEDPSAQEWKAVWQGEGDSAQKTRWEKRGRWLSALVHGDDKSWSDLARGAGVRGMQSVLACLGAHGWPCDPGKVDGAAGPRTFNGIVQFLSRHHNSKKTGKVSCALRFSSWIWNFQWLILIARAGKMDGEVEWNA
ncbi:MAG: hypothetical protein IPO40_03775 [Fibrobacteres bacterium]|nr:hypothetical protein [Fibrobacterota bacterium]